MSKYLIVGLGGFLGAIARYWLGGLFKVESGDFPLGTFVINLTGSFILGLFLTLITEKFVVPAEWRLFFATGFVGAYTTFSSFSNEVIILFRQGYWLTGLLYSVGSLVGGMLCVWVGLLVARQPAFGAISPVRVTLAQQGQPEQAGGNKSAEPTSLLPLEEKNDLDLD